MGDLPLHLLTHQFSVCIISVVRLIVLSRLEAYDVTWNYVNGRCSPVRISLSALILSREDCRWSTCSYMRGLLHPMIETRLRDDTNLMGAFSRYLVGG